MEFTQFSNNNCLNYMQCKCRIKLNSCEYLLKHRNGSTISIYLFFYWFQWLSITIISQHRFYHFDVICARFNYLVYFKLFVLYLCFFCCTGYLVQNRVLITRLLIVCVFLTIICVFFAVLFCLSSLQTTVNTTIVTVPLKHATQKNIGCSIQ